MSDELRDQIEEALIMVGYLEYIEPEDDAYPEWCVLIEDAIEPLLHLMKKVEERGAAKVRERVEKMLTEKSFFIPTEYAKDALIYSAHVRAALNDQPTTPKDPS